MPVRSTRPAIAVFTRDLRVHDNPTLTRAVESAERVVPVFVRDRRVRSAGFATPPRVTFIEGCLADLDASLRERGAGLLVREGDLVEEVVRLAGEVDAATVHIAADASAFATAREERLRDALDGAGVDLVLHSGVHNVIDPGAIAPSGRNHFSVFSPYARRWAEEERRSVLPAPDTVTLPDGLDVPGLEAPEPLAAWPPGETAARERVEAWLDLGQGDTVVDYAERHDDLAGDGTSRLSPYLHFGCISALELATRAAGHRGAGREAYVRQLAWRDFHHQVLAARPDAAHADYRNPREWNDDPEALARWKEGRTGIPLVDAGMRQLVEENWMHNRARLVVGSFLAKTLNIDWRLGAEHFLEHLVDGDLANNQMNWQWVAGTGTDTRPNRVLNPLRQAAKLDPQGDYVRRWVPELAGVQMPRDVHEPWRLGTDELERMGYPEPMVELRSPAG